MAGALNKRSDNFLRILISGLVASTIGGFMLFGIFQLSSANVVTGIAELALTVLARILCSVIVAVIAKVFFWYDMAVSKNPNISS